ncbi:hypothetical protein LOY52_04745 [Pseudomonas sp. B21-051]|uniref:hypothetical protein n=1 Tax=Pseudomonas sp. B21-051 TaxID=2895491 RepID=UPI00215E3776|nr:hypothetical protein [Pseudomonas sp. B21-051]UVK89381.1 hypothetical protein LOY52_04745 [Pseudomonas sp. B21-051]
MRVWFSGVICLLLVACTQPVVDNLSGHAPQQTRLEQEGHATAAALAARYADTRRDCGSASTPAFLCSGILFRGTIHSPLYHFWNPSPIAAQKGGVSFSFLRRDSQFRQIDSTYDHGFVFYPILSMPPDKRRIEILCVFPIDGATFDRDNPGCGAHRAYPQQSRRCQSQGITTAEQWLAHVVRPGVAQSYYQCSFDVRDQMNVAAADAFYQAIRVMTLHRDVAFHSRNEMMLATWPQDIPAQLPIQALYYVGNGLPAAQYDQQDFYDRSGVMLPIIRIRLPATPADVAAFAFDLRDQVFDPQSKLLRISSLTASPQGDPFTFAPDSGFPMTGFSGARFRINVMGGRAPYVFSSSDPGTARVDPRTGDVTLVGHAQVLFTIKDAAGQSVQFSMPKAKLWFTALACHQNWATANSFSIGFGAALPRPQELGNSYLLRYPGALYPEWGDMVRGYQWPIGAFDVSNNHDAHVAEYWTAQASQAGSYVTATVTLGSAYYRPAGWKLCSVAVLRQ